ncbi:MAG: GntR family transcriptional regulator [Balneolaceae bacterium]
MTLKKGIPRHAQITKWLFEQIEEGEYQADEKLPSENELAKKFDVSRVTIRRALQSLESDELIYRCQGVGSFVSDGRKKHSLVELTDFNEDMTKAGLVASSVVKRFDVITAPRWVAERLNIEDDMKVLRVDRLRLGDGEPVAFDISWLPILYGQLLDKKALQQSTIYKQLEENYDIPVIRGCYRMSAELADPEVAKHLDVPGNSALFLIDRISYTIGEKPVYYQKRYYRNDKVIYEMTLERDQAGDGSSQEMPLKEFVPIFKP